ANDRRRFTWKPETLTDEPAGDCRVGPSAEDEALSALETSAALDMLDGLTPDQRSVIALRFIADLSVDFTAEVLGASPGAVKQLTRRALLRLRREISEEAVTR
ncbi:MAG: sigma-70 family RNA polymerase sigma factor, partial [Acidobacteria bacterium]|nr:sigma-70 family RNA polymerase sigma factor [Acidobacteriota bacterium]